ncbi:MAG: hypothetical protein UR84_C0024G0012 [candidate division WS6 bacterium GW2011_GWD1_35_594]|nr:MAG: hypothetical protein UR84_C0024G0012 [candidate division WS6 bacterium GW2011_GWD1_35_594]
MAIRIGHKGVCGGLCGWWLKEPDYSPQWPSKNYAGPSGLPVEPGEDVHCGKCGCRVGIADMVWQGKVVVPDFSRMLSQNRTDGRGFTS